jgi:hypothetical protein
MKHDVVVMRVNLVNVIPRGKAAGNQREGHATEGQMMKQRMSMVSVLQIWTFFWA